MALNGHAGSHQICPLLKVDRTCHRAAVTSHVDPLVAIRSTHPGDAAAIHGVIELALQLTSRAWPKPMGNEPQFARSTVLVACDLTTAKPGDGRATPTFREAQDICEGGSRFAPFQCTGRAALARSSNSFSWRRKKKIPAAAMPIATTSKSKLIGPATSLIFSPNR